MTPTHLVLIQEWNDADGVAKERLQSSGFDTGMGTDLITRNVDISIS